MAVCKFFLQGNCKFGDRCKFDHPGAQNQLRGNQQNQNRYAPLNNANTGGQAARGPQRGETTCIVSYLMRTPRYNLDPDIVHVDLTSDRPIWPFSVYAPGRTAPRHLIEGPVMEQSPEEMRLRYYAAMRTGTPQEAAHEETQLLGEMNQQIQNILGDLNGACRYVQDGENVHPNRLDNTGGAPGQQQQQTGTFARGNTGMGQPSAFGTAPKPAFGQPSAFGGASGQQQSAFGAPSQPQGAFGRPSTFGASANQPSAFGAPSALGGAAANPAFGKPAFGAPSAFGQAANAGSTAGAAPAFGQPSQPSAFGQPGGGAFGAKPGFGQPAGGSAFGQPSQPGGTGAFGKPTGAPGFGQSGFGQAAQQTGNSGFAQLGQQQQQQPGGFGQAWNQQAGAGAFGQQQPSANAFGQPAAKPAAFGAPAQAAPSAFGAPTQQAAPSAFGAPAQQAAPSAFGAPTQQAAPSAFGQPAMNGPSAPQSNGFGQQQRQPQSNPTPGVAAGADVSTYTTRGNNNQLTSWKGQPVQYMNGNPCYRRPDNGAWERIWLPDGAPPENPYCYAKPEVYGEVLKEAYEYLNRTGTFKDGIMPEEPPMHTAIRWDV
ncbi:Nucleoporin-like protein 2 [Diplodia seriata]|uniref:Nucleoporin-like protein 2 n=1 Tax=Diplodia seriata TaxID=420778 RepID=A0A1S8BF33_9PEZI|nr:Nucleoporin-like protein 2 [Diplodia seriata]